MSYFHHDHLHPHPRRKFLKKSFLFMGTLASADGVPRVARPAEMPEAPKRQAVDAQPQPAPRQEDTEPVRIFDAHLHCPSDQTDQVWQWYPVTRTFEEFARYLDRTGVQRGIINNVRCQLAKTPADFIAGNREVARYVEKYRGRFLGAAVVNPLFINESLREIEDLKEFEMLVQQVVKLNMVLDVHTELEEMEYIIQKFPQATIVFPHFGRWLLLYRILGNWMLLQENSKRCSA